ncbi:SDR family NAD(P)-dependent oxidoreductase [Plantactinospora soyae]|uniref:Probable oxidoreductase n=1 Tax=Plantactinospora soyae TaxID=1544732 RepID=A0A927M219_9ACTN|nr:SDR family NAD(P)-dependent oxidoreductase [Plantactinospora soyae]MBE1485390.1 NAD(P)-dependent dehydrogenase (short-subunit alcohol dehydrogenase family) [Plantactinospora soyae]
MDMPQATTGSTFGARSTAEEVLRGIDLAGKLAVVTGGYSGLGLETTRALAGAGARVVVPARRREVAGTALDGTVGVEIDEMDLADLASIRGFAERFLDSGRDIDIVINNAGIMACSESRVGPGWEAQFAVNHLGHHALVNLLWPAIAGAGAARVVAVSSGVGPQSPIRWDDPHFTRGYDKWQAYAQSKEANRLFAVRLDVLGRDFGVRAYSVHPGYILTPLQRHLATAEMVDAGWIDEQGNPVNAEFKTPAQGAATQVWAATSPELAGLGGVYCKDCAVVAPHTRATGPDAGPGTADADDAVRLWALSAELTGVDAFASRRRSR